MNTNKTEKLMINGRLTDASGFNIENDGSENYVYEVIRVIDGRILFAEEHYSRLKKSLAFIGKKMIFSFEDMLDSIHELVDANSVSNDNIRLVVDNFKGSRSYDVIIMLMHASYPSAEDYMHGVPTEFYHAVRLNPQLKMRNRTLRQATNEIIREKKLFELILVDDDGDITEGSRSNIFLIKDGTIYTSPAEFVLLGVTRMKIIEVCLANGYEIVEQYIAADTIDDYDAAFISGTSPKVLPICRIGDVNMDVNNKILREIMKIFNEEIERSLAE